INYQLRIALKKAIVKGELKQVKGNGASGSFRLGEKKCAPAVKKMSAGRSAYFVPHSSAKITSLPNLQRKKPKTEKKAKSPKKTEVPKTKTFKKSVSKAAKPKTRNPKVSGSK
ncbi:hypothetical protein Angca_000577, partial [Angiostrongylus cantonensis]